MSDYIVTFDLHVNNDEINEYYSKIEDYLKSLTKYVKPTNNVYIVSSDTISSVDIRDTIKKICDNKGYVLVLGLNRTYASYNLEEINEQLIMFFK